MSRNDSDLNKNLMKYIDIFHKELQSQQNKYSNDELEIRFGTNWKNPITRNNFENTICKLKSSGWWGAPGENKEHDVLKIQTERYNQSTAKKQMNNIRIELSSMNTIQKYCKTNSLPSEELKANRVIFLKKKNKFYNDEKLFPIDYRNFEFRVNYKQEDKMNTKSHQVGGILEDWNTSRKTFRLLKRYSFIHKLYPFRIDCSIVKSSSKKNGYLIPTWNIHESNVFNNNETYEIEVEFYNKKILHRGGPEYIKNLYTEIRQVIKLILSGLQGTNFPISFSEIDLTRRQYLSLIYYGEKPPETKKINSKYFIGPSSISLEMQNIQKHSSELTINTILEPYTVTDKADGKRKLLYINKEGKIYLIDTNMNIQFTGCITKHKENWNSILDGEHVETDKHGNYINIYLAFDIYIKNRKDLRAYPFLSIADKDFEFSDKNMEKNIWRYKELTDFIKHLDARSIIKDKEGDMKFERKAFYDNLNEQSIFDKCKIILDQEKNDFFRYEIDGLIFTPAYLGVGSDKIGKAGSKNKITWHSSFKWKPPKYNSIDFLIKTKKDEFGNEIIRNKINTGTNMVGSNQYTSTKVILLHVGWDSRTTKKGSLEPNKHGYLDPVNDIINDNIPEKKWSNYDEETYTAQVFKPTNPTPNWNVYEQEIKLKNSNEVGKGVMMTDEDNPEPFEDNTIVEFRWDSEFSLTDDHMGYFVPIRVRHDKTSEFRKGRRNYGNAYHVANSVWKSIHNPVTEQMISTGINIPEYIEDQAVYYKQKSTETTTRGLRDFHNRYVKRKLIKAVCKAGDNLIDQSVGKAGDLHKWIDAKLNFVFGIDVHSDNIENRKDGAATRYLETCKRRKRETIPKALFIVANSSKNILSGEAAMGNYKYKQIINYVFGNIDETDPSVGKGVLKVAKIAENKFDVVSNQFSIHYFFKDVETVHNFIRNVCECCKVSGYFIGTTYNGEKIFKKLNKKKEKESLSIINDGEKMWEIKKMYNKDSFPNDENSLGYAIGVWQETINKYFTEYLVNFEYFKYLMKIYGFDILTKDNLSEIGFKHSIGSFKELFNMMNSELTDNKLNKNDIASANKMNKDEQKISFLNNYFIFQKKRDVDAKNIFNLYVNKSVQEKLHKELEEGEIDEDSPVKIPIKRKVKKLKTKFKLPQ